MSTHSNWKSTMTIVKHIYSAYFFPDTLSVRFALLLPPFIFFCQVIFSHFPESHCVVLSAKNISKLIPLCLSSLSFFLSFFLSTKKSCTELFPHTTLYCYLICMQTLCVQVHICLDSDFLTPSIRNCRYWWTKAWLVASQTVRCLYYASLVFRFNRFSQKLKSAPTFPICCLSNHLLILSQLHTQVVSRTFIWSRSVDWHHFTSSNCILRSCVA